MKGGKKVLWERNKKTGCNMKPKVFGIFSFFTIKKKKRKKKSVHIWYRNISEWKQNLLIWKYKEKKNLIWRKRTWKLSFTFSYCLPFFLFYTFILFLFLSPPLPPSSSLPKFFFCSFTTNFFISSARNRFSFIPTVIIFSFISIASRKSASRYVSMSVQQLTQLVFLLLKIHWIGEAGMRKFFRSVNFQPFKFHFFHFFFFIFLKLQTEIQ